jgi:hypothetical protein
MYRKRLLWTGGILAFLAVLGAIGWCMRPRGKLGTFEEVRARLDQHGFHQFTKEPEEVTACSRKAHRWRFVGDATHPDEAWLDIYVGFGGEQVIAAVTQAIEIHPTAAEEKAMTQAQKDENLRMELGATGALCALLGTGTRKYHCMRNAPEGWKKWYPEKPVYYKIYRLMEMQCEVQELAEPPKEVIRTYRVFPLCADD